MYDPSYVDTSNSLNNYEHSFINIKNCRNNTQNMFHFIYIWPPRKTMASFATGNNGACLVEEAFLSLERYRKLLEADLSKTGFI